MSESGVTEREMNERANGKPNEARLKRWINSVGTVTLPLLAGFSVASVVIVSDDPAKFRWPGATILALIFAALVLIVAVQCAYHAHVYLSTKDPDDEKGQFWARLTRRFYDAGLFTLLVGLALVVASPYHATGTQADLRWAAFGLACFACLCEVVWVLRDGWLRSAWHKF